QPCCGTLRRRTGECYAHRARRLCARVGAHHHLCCACRTSGERCGDNSRSLKLTHPTETRSCRSYSTAPPPGGDGIAERRRHRRTATALRVTASPPDGGTRHVVSPGR